MNKILSLLVIGMLAFSGLTFAGGTSGSSADRCINLFYKGYGTNAKLLWKNVAGGVLPITNAEAIVMWENTIKVQKAANRDYSASIVLHEAAVAEAKTLDPNAQAKNPLFDAKRFEDKPDLYWDCKNGK